MSYAWLPSPIGPIIQTAIPPNRHVTYDECLRSTPHASQGGLTMAIKLGIIGAMEVEVDHLIAQLS